ncbi:MAG TPA: hypothetical protein VGH03_19095 [Caulobacteraceae bacterium]|jgi:hypothetical protein
MRLHGPGHRLALVRRTISIAAVAIAGLLAVSAAAGPMGGGPSLTQDDIARSHAAVTRLNEGRSIGAVERWRNPESRNAGEVILVRSFTARGMPCHTIRYVIRYHSQPATPKRLELNWCQLPAKGWKIVELKG